MDAAGLSLGYVPSETVADRPMLYRALHRSIHSAEYRNNLCPGRNHDGPRLATSLTAYAVELEHSSRSPSFHELGAARMVYRLRFSEDPATRQRARESASCEWRAKRQRQPLPVSPMSLHLPGTHRNIWSAGCFRRSERKHRVHMTSTASAEARPPRPRMQLSQ